MDLTRFKSTYAEQLRGLPAPKISSIFKKTKAIGDPATVILEILTQRKEYQQEKLNRKVSPTIPNPALDSRGNADRSIDKNLEQSIAVVSVIEQSATNPEIVCGIPETPSVVNIVSSAEPIVQQSDCIPTHTAQIEFSKPGKEIESPIAVHNVQTSPTVNEALNDKKTQSIDPCTKHPPESEVTSAQPPAQSASAQLPTQSASAQLPTQSASAQLPTQLPTIAQLNEYWGPNYDTSCRDLKISADSLKQLLYEKRMKIIASHARQDKRGAFNGNAEARIRKLYNVLNDALLLQEFNPRKHNAIEILMSVDI